MKRIFIAILLTISLQTGWCQNACPVIPLPATAQKTNGTFSLNPYTPLLADAALEPVAYYLQKELLRLKDVSLSRQTKATIPAIKLELSNKVNSASESYSLIMKPEGITISAPDRAGVLYGVISLLQLAQFSESSAGNIALPCWHIQDAPQYGWRGVMLDESRHFFGKEQVKSLLNWMAFYKLNRFHWHLTDEPGWRLQIQQYKLLALVGGIGNYTNPYAPAQYYTQEEIKEIVAYAAERNIVVIPEIDMPGHATAANRAYPEFSGGGSEKHPEFTFNPGREGTYTYLTNILREVNVLFPAQMLHVGGDEVSYGNEKWKTNEDIMRLMKDKKLADEKAVERYFMQRMADSVYQMNAKLLVWDEMADVDLPVDKTIVFWWRHDKPEQLKTALNKGYATVLCPRLPFYFDFVQDSTHRYGRKWNKLYNSLKSVYDFSAEDIPAAKNKTKLILGMQANLWTETVPTLQRLEYLLFPRITALAEAAWTAPAQRNYQQYLLRLQKQLPLYHQQGIYYYDPFSTTENPEPPVYRK